MTEKSIAPLLMGVIGVGSVSDQLFVVILTGACSASIHPLFSQLFLLLCAVSSYRPQLFASIVVG
jgi:hypothetical protein